eukprot:COSAG04_NODE_10_length_43369_cov_4.059025_35_plen_107_part_00
MVELAKLHDGKNFPAYIGVHATAELNRFVHSSHTLPKAIFHMLLWQQLPTRAQTREACNTSLTFFCVPDAPRHHPLNIFFKTVFCASVVSGRYLNMLSSHEMLVLS